MPARGGQAAGQDWAPQAFNFGPRPGSGTTAPKKVSESTAARVIQRGGAVEVTRKMSSGNHHTGLGAGAKRLDDDHETTRIRHVDPMVAGNIQRYRQIKGLTQAELAKLINERTQIVGDYEAGRAIPNESVLVRMEKALGVHLRGAKAGQAMETKPKGPPGSTLAA